MNLNGMNIFFLIIALLLLADNSQPRWRKRWRKFSTTHLSRREGDEGL